MHRFCGRRSVAFAFLFPLLKAEVIGARLSWQARCVSVRCHLPRASLAVSRGAGGHGESVSIPGSCRDGRAATSPPHQTPPGTARKVWQAVGPSTCALTSWFFKGKRNEPVWVSQGRAGMPSRLYGSSCSACQGLDPRGKHLSPLLTVAALWGLCVSHLTGSPTASQGGVHPGTGTEGGNFKLNTVTVYKIEALIEKK